MDRVFRNRPMNAKAIFDFSHIEKHVQSHLRNVYVTLSMGLLAAAVGSYLHLFTTVIRFGMLSWLASIGLIIAVFMTPHNASNVPKRVGFFMGFALCTGLGLGPLLEQAIHIDPSIIPTAFMGTAVIFVSFSMCSLFSRNRSFLYLGGMLTSALSMLCLISLGNLFFRSYFMFNVQLYAGFAIFCLFVLFDTQLIVEKRRHGDDDFIWHAIDLFLDMIQIFRHLLIILGKKKNERED